MSSATPCASSALSNSGSPTSSFSTCCLSTSGSAQSRTACGGPMATRFCEAKRCRTRRTVLKHSQRARLQARAWWGEGGGMGGRDIATRMVSKPKFSAALRRPGPLHHARLWLPLPVPKLRMRRSYRSQNTPSSPINQRPLLQTCPPLLPTAVPRQVRGCVPSPESKTRGT